MEPESEQTEALFTAQCGDRVVFCIGLLVHFQENEQLHRADWLSIAKRAQEAFGAWPVHFLDRDEQRRQCKNTFTGYRIAANCSALDPNDPNRIEKAILIWHQSSTSLLVSDTALKQIFDLGWVQLAEATDF